MIIVKPEGAPPCCRSEREFLRAVHSQPGVFIANVNVPNSTLPGAFTREVDGVMLTPHGIYTVEVKGLRAQGELHTPRMDAWTVGEDKVPLMGRPHAQALAHSKYLASFLKETGIAPGWIRAVLAIVGEGITLPDGADVLLVDNVHVVISRPGVGEVLREQVGATMSQRELSVEMVTDILTAFECMESAPARADLIAEGFRTEADIAAEVEEKRQQVRQEFLAATAHAETADPALPPSSALEAVADLPSTTEWRTTEERYNAALALDAELTETGAFVHGVAMHRRLVSYAERKGMDLAEIASVVNDPVEILGDDSDANLIYCGAHHAVSVRTLDGLAMFYKPVDVARAERQGTVINGVEITPRAAKQAVNQFGLTLEAVTRIVNGAQERWWVTGTTDVAHARGDFVAVTAGHLGPVQYVQTRAVAVHRAAPKPAAEESPDPKVADVEMAGITIRASAVGWCHRRNVPLETIAQIASQPLETWAGHSTSMEVRCGESNAVLLDVATQTVVAVMTNSEAVEYRDGITKDGVLLSGRCLFLAKRRKVSVDDVISAYRAPVLIARAPGASESVYIGADLAVNVEDESGAVTDFTFAGHARARMSRNELMPVDLGAVPPGEHSTGPGRMVNRTYAPRPGLPKRPSPALLAQSRRTAPAPSKGSVPVSPMLMARRRQPA